MKLVLFATTALLSHSAQKAYERIWFDYEESDYKYQFKILFNFYNSRQQQQQKCSKL